MCTDLSNHATVLQFLTTGSYTTGILVKFYKIHWAGFLMSEGDSYSLLHLLPIRYTWQKEKLQLHTPYSPDSHASNNFTTCFSCSALFFWKHNGIVKNIHRMLYFILPPDTTKSNYMCLYAQHVLTSGFLGFYCNEVAVSVLLKSEAISLFLDILTFEGETTTMHWATGINYPVMQHHISEERRTPIFWLVAILEDITMFKINLQGLQKYVHN